MAVAKSKAAKAFSLEDFDALRADLSQHQKLSRLLEETASVERVTIALPFHSGGTAKVPMEVAEIRKIIRTAIAGCEKRLAAFGIKPQGK